MKKGTIIKTKDGKYKLFCKDKEWFVFGKLTCHRDKSTTMSFTKTAVYSSLPEFRYHLTDKVIK